MPFRRFREEREVPLPRPITERADHLVAVAEVVPHETAGDAGLLRHSVEGRAFDAVAHEARGIGIEQLGAADLCQARPAHGRSAYACG